MKETILNIYLVINDGIVSELRAKGYQLAGSDEEKIFFLKSKAESDFTSAETFDAPEDNLGRKISYNKFYKLEKQGLHFQLFEHIFGYFKVQSNPLVCVTPVVDGKILSENVFVN